VIDRSQMSQVELHAWMVGEAMRLIEARAQIERPKNPVWTNRISNPNERAPDLERAAVDSASNEVVKKLRLRDEADDNARNW
jgi:hypothetical protein